MGCGLTVYSVPYTALLAVPGSKDKRLVLYPGGFHGWQIVEEAPYAPKARSVVLSWLRKHGG